jgi:hypothetical protein
MEFVEVIPYSGDSRIIGLVNMDPDTAETGLVLNSEESTAIPEGSVKDSAIPAHCINAPVQQEM